MRLNRGTLYLLVLTTMTCNLLWPPSAMAQADRGTIAGTVKDTTNAVLLGALVEVQPQGKRVVSDGQGQFRITDLPPGDYTLTVSYVGFATFTTPVKVTGGQVANLDAVLKVASQTSEVNVIAEFVSGEAEAINIERTSDNIVQILPSKVITSLPNTNVADAVGRLPSVTLERDEGEGKYVQIRGTEPRLSNVTINGVNVPSPEGGVRNIKLDVIPSGLVDRIEVNKTLSANQDADAIGGSVNLVTRMAQNKPLLAFGGMGGYTPIQGGRPLGTFNGDFGQRFGAKKQFGFLLGGAYDYNARGIDDLEPTQAAAAPGGTSNGVTNNTSQNVAFVANEDLRSYSYYRTRYGLAGGLDYNLTDGSNLYLKGLYSDFHDFGDTWVYSPSFGSTITAVNGSQLSFSPDGSMAYRHYIRRPDQQIFSVLTGGRHDLNSTLIVYEFAVSRSHNVGGQDFPTTHFGYTGPAVAFTEDLSNPRRPNFKVLNGVNIFDPTQYTLADTNLPQQRSTQLNFQGSAWLARRYNLASHFGTFEFGLQIRNAHKYLNQDDQLLTPNNTFTLAQVQGTYTNNGYYDGTFGPYGPTSDYKKIHQLVLNAANFTSAQQVVGNAQASFDANERVYAGYLMNTINFGKLRLQTGVRIEATDATYGANQLNFSNGTFISAVPITGASGYINVLPSVQAQYPLGNDTNLRVGYGRGISRPNFTDIVPTKQIDPNTTPQTLSVGNPALRPTTANNYDVLVEHFFHPLGILQGGFFYKQLSDPIYPTVTLLAPPDPNAGFLQFQSINGPSAHIAGVEMAWEQRLSRLPGLLSGFGVAANYSYTTSQVTFPAGFSGGRIDHPTLQRQAPNTWNLGMTYDKARFSMRFAVTHNDANIFAYQFSHVDAQTDKDPILGIRGPLGDQYLYAHTQFDVQGSYRLYKGFSLVAYGLNLSNEVFGFYTGSPIYPNQREYYHPTVAIGARWSSRTE